MTRDEVIKALEYLISDDCRENQLDYVDEIICAIALLKAESVVRCDECEYAGFGDCLLTAGAQLDGCLRGKRRQDNDKG